MLDNYQNFEPRNWALQNTGSHNSTKKLNSEIKKNELASGREFKTDLVEKINAPNLEYKNNQDLLKFENDYLFLNQSQRSN